MFKLTKKELDFDITPRHRLDGNVIEKSKRKKKEVIAGGLAHQLEAYNITGKSNVLSVRYFMRRYEIELPKAVEMYRYNLKHGKPAGGRPKGSLNQYKTMPK